MVIDSRRRLGDILVEEELLTQEQLDQVLLRRRGTGQSVTRLLAESGFVDEEDIVATLTQHCGVPYVRLAAYNVAPEVARRSRDRRQ